jgi:hypothetical protein
MITKLNIPPQYRYERKFVLSGMSRAEVIHRIKIHPAFFREIYHPRQINNIYLDTDSLQFFKDNQIGVAERKKVRVRWYGEIFGEVKNPKLEYKIKSGLLGDKNTFALPEFELTKHLIINRFYEYLQQSNLPEPVAVDLQILSPTLLNSYQRTYFQTADKKFRLTVDEDLTYYRINKPETHFQAKHIEKESIIIELKYAPENELEAGSIMNLMPFRLDKSSKYVNGVEFFERR